jgi:hypothetical protein
MSLSDIGSWASIVGLILSFAAGFGVCRVTKNNQLINKFFAIFSIGNVSQKNENNK